MLTQFLAAILVAVIAYALIGAGIFIYRLITTRRSDTYLVRYYGKSKQRPVKGAKDIIPADPYSEIINDYPTYHRQELK